MTTNILYLLVPISIAWFGVFLRQAFEMEKERRHRRMWGTIAWSLIPFGVSALVWMHQGDASVFVRNVLLGGLGAAIGASLMIWLGYILSENPPRGMVPIVANNVPVSQPNPLPAPVAPAAPSKPLSPRAIRELLEALSDARNMQTKFIAPTMGQVSNWAANWRGVLRNNNGVQLYSRLRDELKTQVWENIDSLIENNKNHQAELEAVFALDHPAAKNELSRALQAVIEAVQRLPRNSPPEMDDLLEPQFRELIKQSNLGWEWVTEVDRRINRMTENINNRGIADYK